MSKVCYPLIVSLVLLLLPARGNAQRHRISTGYSHTVAIKADGTLWGWGSNASGELGDGTTTLRKTPQLISATTDWVSVSAGSAFTLALRHDGTLWAWGSRANGRLGVTTNSTSSYLNQPTQVGTDTTWVAVSAGEVHALAVRRDGTLWAWGSNFGGELGMGSYNVGVGEPTQVGTGTNWRQVSAGNGYSLAIRQNGTLWAWGLNSNGQAGISSGMPVWLPSQVGTASDWIAISAGDLHSLGIRSNGSLWGWGLNDAGQLAPVGTFYSFPAPVSLSPALTWASVSAGSFNSFATRADGTLWAWGNDATGNLGVGRQATAFMQSVSPGAAWLEASAGYNQSIGVRADGSIWSWGYNPHGEVGTTALTLFKVTQPLQIGATTSWTKMAAGYRHTAAIRADSTLWLWGANDNGQLGEPLTVANHFRAAPAPLARGQKWLQVASGRDCTMAIRADGTLWAWGANSRSQLGLGVPAASTSAFFTPQQVGTATNWARIELGDMHTLALRADGTLWAWGSNYYGQVGNGSSGSSTYDDVKVPLPIAPGNTWQEIGAGHGSSMALRADGSIWAWGENGVGQLGDGTTSQKNSPVRIGTALWTSLAVGTGHTLAVQRNGTLWSWGYNLAGQLGDGTTTNRLSPVPVGNATNWTKVRAGVGHSLALKADGTAWEWGAQVYELNYYSPPVGVTRPAMVAGGSWAALAAGYAHSVALGANGTLSAWGLNWASQLGNPIFSDVPVAMPLVAGPLAVAPTAATLKQPLLVFPNPAHQSATLIGADNTAPVLVTDLLGRTLKKLRANGEAFSVEDLAPGLYLVQQGRQTTKLVVE
jgi:alpha-tubulin suppressor-like RCC1 family protein